MSKVNCSECPKTFAREFTLKRHKEIAHAERQQRYPCDQCNETFTRKDHLARHQDIHTLQGYEDCSYCFRSFGRGYLQKHQVSCSSRRSTCPSSAHPLAPLVQASSNGLRPLVEPYNSLFSSVSDDISPSLTAESSGTDFRLGEITPRQTLPRASKTTPSIRELIKTIRKEVKRAVKEDDVTLLRGVQRYAYGHDGSQDLVSFLKLFQIDLALDVAIAGSIKIAQYLITAKVQLGERELIKASDWHNLATVELLLEAGVKGTPNNLRGALSFAVRQGSLRVVVLLLEHGADVHGTSDSDSPLLHEAISYNQTIMAQFIIEAGVDLDRADLDGTTALHLTAQEGIVDVMADLINHGANIDAAAASDCATPLCLAAWKNQKDAVRLLLARGASVNGAGGMWGTTPLLRAFSKFPLDKEVVQLLLDANPMVNLCRPERQWDRTTTALAGACAAGGPWTNPFILRLLELGADANLGEHNPLSLALQYTAAGDVACLLFWGVNVDNVGSKDMNGLWKRVSHPAPWYDGPYAIEPEQKLWLLEIYGKTCEDNDCHLHPHQLQFQ